MMQRRLTCNVSCVRLSLRHLSRQLKLLLCNEQLLCLITDLCISLLGFPFCLLPHSLLLEQCISVRLRLPVVNDLVKSSMPCFLLCLWLYLSLFPLVVP